MQVENVAAGGQGRLPSVKLHGQSASLQASRGVVVAVDGPAARELLGSALDAEPSQPGPGVGTCNLYFR